MQFYIKSFNLRCRLQGSISIQRHSIWYIGVHAIFTKLPRNVLPILCVSPRCYIKKAKNAKFSKPVWSNLSKPSAIRLASQSITLSYMRKTYDSFSVNQSWNFSSNLLFPLCFHQFLPFPWVSLQLQGVSLRENIATSTKSELKGNPKGWGQWPEFGNCVPAKLYVNKI